MKRYFFVLASLLFVNIASAQIIYLKGMGTVKYQAVLSVDDKNKAIENAEMNAIERYFAEKGDADSQIYDTNEDLIRKNIEKIILNPVVLSEQDSPSLQKYQVTIKAEVNESKLNNVIKSSSLAASTSSTEKSNIVYFFTARIANTVKTYDARIVKINQSSDQSDAAYSDKENGSEGEKITKNKVATNANTTSKSESSSNKTSKVESGGSVTTKATEVGYQILPMTNYKSATTSIFDQAGFSVIDSDFVLTNQDVDNVYKDYSVASDISPSTMKSLIKKLKTSKEHITYLVFSTLDVGLPSRDPSSGLPSINVYVTGRVFNLDGNIPKEIASVPTIQISSVGKNDEEAKTSALKKASEQASREIIAQLNNLRIK